MVACSILDARHCEVCDDTFIAVTLLLTVPLDSKVFCKACLRRYDRPLFWLAAVSADMEIFVASVPLIQLVGMSLCDELDVPWVCETELLHYQLCSRCSPKESPNETRAFV